MKAWEETWEYLSGGWPPDVFRKGTNEKIADVWGEGSPYTHAPAMLIAAAPEMARLLLETEWFMTYECAVCPFCLGEQGNGDHADDCPRQAVLTKAGVLPSR